MKWWILALLFFAIAINILDRQVLSLVAPDLRERFALSNTQYGQILFCFLLGMTVGQVPMGIMIDRKGPRLGLSVAVSWWSAANLLHAFARTVPQFGALRFLLGLGECGSYSGGVKVIGQWFPPEQRALAGGIFNSGSLFGAIAAPPLIIWIMLRYGWQSAFVLPSLAGLLWLLPWLATQHLPAPDPLAEPHSSRWMLLSQRAVWGVILMRSFGGPVSHFYWYWLPEYLKHERHMPLETIGWLAWMPFFSGGCGNLGGGWFSSWLIRRGWVATRARRIALTIAVALCLAAALVPAAPNTGTALGLICIAALGINAFAANLIGLITDLFPQAVLAQVTALTGVGDGGASMLAMLLTGMAIDHFSYVPVFLAAALLPILALIAMLTLTRSRSARQQ